MKQITGNTYPVKDAIRAMGGRWNARAKAWEVPDELEAAARALVGEGQMGRRPQGYYASRRDPGGLYTPGGRCIGRVSCGCEDYPCCGC